MVIGVALGQFQARAELAQPIFKTFRRGDAANRSDISVAKPFERDLLAGEDVLQMKRLVRALDDFRGAIEASNTPDQLVVRLTGAFRDEDIAGAAKIARRLAQGSAREQVFVSERRLAIDQDDVEPVFEVEILQAVVEQERVGL